MTASQEFLDRLSRNSFAGDRAVGKLSPKA